MKYLNYILFLLFSLLFVQTGFTAPPPPPGPTPVTVVNGTATPVPVTDVDNPARQPFQHPFNFTFDPTQGGNGTTFVVPSGKRLVIEYASATIGLERGAIVDVLVATTVNGVEGQHHLIPTPMGPAWGFPLSYLVSKDLRVYADAGTTVSFGMTDTISGAGISFGTISGYLVNQ